MGNRPSAALLAFSENMLHYAQVKIHQPRRGDDLEAYLRDLQEIPPPTDAELKELLPLAAAGDADARERLTVSSLPRRSDRLQLHRLRTAPG